MDKDREPGRGEWGEAQRRLTCEAAAAVSAAVSAAVLLLLQEGGEVGRRLWVASPFAPHLHPHCTSLCSLHPRPRHHTLTSLLLSLTASSLLPPSRWSCPGHPLMVSPRRACSTSWSGGSSVEVLEDVLEDMAKWPYAVLKTHLSSASLGKRCRPSGAQFSHL